MASIYRDNARKGWRCQVYVGQMRRKLWIGDVSKMAANSVAHHLQALANAKMTATSIPEPTVLWASSVGERIKKQIVAWGLVEQASLIQLPRTLRAFCDAVLAERTDYADNTRERWDNVIDKVCAQLGDSTALKSITPGDADRFARWARKNIKSHSHSGKVIKDCRQLFAVAIRNKIISSNPFEGINTAQEHDANREAYIDRATVTQLIEHAPDANWRALIAMSRYAGLRVPSEPLALLWTHIDWAEGKITIPRGTKTGQRICPLFPEIRKELTELHELAPEGATHIFTHNRTSAGTKWRDKFLAIIGRAGVPVWPKLWVNMRASCRTDLDEVFPAKVVNSWLGHGSAIAKKHYARITQLHWDKAIRGVAGGVIETNSGQSARSEKCKTTKKKTVKAPQPRKKRTP